VPEGEVNTAKVGAMQLRSSELKGDRHNVYNKDTLFRPTGPKVSMMDRIIGTWRLIDEIAQDQDGKPLPTLFGPDPMGLVIFTEAGRMMALRMRLTLTEIMYFTTVPLPSTITSSLL
jgi:hypothetical protein